MGTCTTVAAPVSQIRMSSLYSDFETLGMLYHTYCPDTQPETLGDYYTDLWGGARAHHGVSRQYMTLALFESEEEM